MTRRFAVIGGGIAGLAAAYELEKQRRAGADIDWTLYEASDRFGGTVETTRFPTPEGEFVLEGGPDAWVTEKPWARDLAVELGLEGELIVSNDATRKTYVLIDGELQAMPDRMRMMVPEDLATLENSPLFSPAARAAYASELARADELRASAPDADESVSSFVRRHFGEEVLAKIGAPLLSGVFGGDVAKLSVRAVMPAFVAMEREHGSLVAAVQAKARDRAGKPPQPTFTTLRRGLGSLLDAIVGGLPAERLRRHTAVDALNRTANGWRMQVGSQSIDADHLLLATPAHMTRELLRPVDADAAALLPVHASFAVLAAFAWQPAEAAGFRIPVGFGFLVPQAADGAEAGPAMLACTFVDQKFPGRTPPGGRAIRVFYGGNSVQQFASTSDEQIAEQALRELESVLRCGKIPAATVQTVRRWPLSLPQYEVGHMERMEVLNEHTTKLGALHLLGNSYRGVGLPDLIRDARKAVTDSLLSQQ